jgi:hypothetical protein
MEAVEVPMSIAKTSTPTAPQELELASNRYRMIMAAKFTVNSFARQWSHCHLVANYLARYVSANEGDPERHATLLSTFVNELLEVVFRNRADEGEIEVIFRKRARVVVLQLIIPVDNQHRMFYRMAVKMVNQPDLRSWFRARLEEPADGEDTMLGILELVAVFTCTFTLAEPAESNRLSLFLELPEVDEMGEV